MSAVLESNDDVCATVLEALRCGTAMPCLNASTSRLKSNAFKVVADGYRMAEGHSE
jgi:hypothetical protein